MYGKNRRRLTHEPPAGTPPRWTPSAPQNAPYRLGTILTSPLTLDWTPLVFSPLAFLEWDTNAVPSLSEVFCSRLRLPSFSQFLPVRDAPLFLPSGSLPSNTAPTFVPSLVQRPFPLFHVFTLPRPPSGRHPLGYLLSPLEGSPPKFFSRLSGLFPLQVGLLVGAESPPRILTFCDFSSPFLPLFFSPAQQSGIW